MTFGRTVECLTTMSNDVTDKLKALGMTCPEQVEVFDPDLFDLSELRLFWRRRESAVIFEVDLLMPKNSLGAIFRTESTVPASRPKFPEIAGILRCIQEVQGIAQTLETESGGILVTVERISKGFAILVYRGKNYKQPASLRPRTLLSKREALKRSIEAQRHKSLILHVLKLTRNVDELKLQLVVHPIHDQCFCVTLEHKRKLKEEFASYLTIWLPASSQKSPIAVDFVSPENLHECIRLTEEVRRLLKNHKAREDKLEGIAQTLETESGGILVTVERISKGFAILVHRGKNYKQPASLRPRTLLSKREALKRSIEAQRHKSLKLHVLKLTRNVDELKLQLAKDKETNKPAKRANFQLARERSGCYSSSFNSNDGTDASTACPETNQQDMPRDSPLLCVDKVDEFNITEPENVSELEREENRLLVGSIGLGVDTQSATCPDDPGSQGSCYLPAVNAESHVGDEKAITPVESTKNGTNNSVHSSVKNIPCGVPVRAVWLSNRDRLLLRKQALKMKKRPVLAVGNFFAPPRGRAILLLELQKLLRHFQRHPLAIVNVKGRAKGTSVQELVSKLEEATGAVLVSHETNKVILYRGWGAEVEPGQTVERNDIKDAMKTSDPRGSEITRFISRGMLCTVFAPVRLWQSCEFHNRFLAFEADLGWA
ncbi:hypothetical protein RHSIM_Rhsim10G0028200 [Rhododendron simsii]|uniref:CRM domain-containing protein n=1 Tax=Rhododendron simsii TaxID=118357 RepID=A0A834GEV5_RHOSS|nr:hypothetical protein RHSIM_Rhsim10G0028200 [Rhododendron simsii]